MKKHKHKVSSGFKGDTPAMKVETQYALSDEGIKVPVGTYRADQVRGDGVYNPRKGWRKIRQYKPHTLLNNLFIKIGLKPLYNI